MGNGTSGSRDVERATEEGQHWPPELAEATTKKTQLLSSADPNLHNGAYNAGLKSSEDPNQPNQPNLPNSTEEFRRGTTI